MRTGGCHCGAVRYAVAGELLHNSICHCADCRACAGAPAVAWIGVPEDQLTVIQGTVTTYLSKAGSRRQFCPHCGTGLFYRNAEVLPGIVDVQSATLDSAAQDAPQLHVQTAEMLPWFDGLAALPRFERFPPG